MSAKTPYKVLFICTGNSARSIMAEYILRARGKGRFESYSAGPHPTGKVNPLALQVLKRNFSIDASGARSKSWDEFKGVKFDFVITVCDRAKENCPTWTGHPITIHWGSPDPAALEGTDAQKLELFVDVASQINTRIGILCVFRDDQLNERQVNKVGDEFRLPDKK